jgi:3-dehydroquinate synthase
VLNFGHTVGHVLETLSGYELRHGEAVAVGLVAEAALGEALQVTRSGVATRVRETLEAARLPVDVDPHIDPDRFVEASGLDKKSSEGRPRYTLISDIGRVAPSDDGSWAHDVPEDVVRKILFGAGKAGAPGV